MCVQGTAKERPLRCCSLIVGTYGLCILHSILVIMVWIILCTYLLYLAGELLLLYLPAAISLPACGGARLRT